MKKNLRRSQQRTQSGHCKKRAHKKQELICHNIAEQPLPLNNIWFTKEDSSNETTLEGKKVDDISVMKAFTLLCVVFEWSHFVDGVEREFLLLFFCPLRFYSRSGKAAGTFEALEEACSQDGPRAQSAFENLMIH